MKNSMFGVSAILFSIWCEFLGIAFLLLTKNPPEYFKYLSIGGFIIGYIFLAIILGVKDKTPPQKERKE